MSLHLIQETTWNKHAFGLENDVFPAPVAPASLRASGRASDNVAADNPSA